MFQRSCAISRLLVSFLMMSLAACGGSDGTPDDSGPELEPAASAGTARGEAPYVVAVFDVAVTPSATTTAVRVSLTRAGLPVTGAAVTAGTGAHKVTLTEAAQGDYTGTIDGAHPSYALSVDTAEGGVYDVQLAVPSRQHASLRPKTQFTWTPNHESVVDDVRVTVVPSASGATSYDAHVGDVGALALPASALDDPSAFVRLERSTSLPLAHGIGFVHVITMTSVATGAE
jgi:hypothetical protein